MTDILEELYFQYFDEAHKPSPAYKAACKEEIALWNKLLPDISRAELEQIQAKHAEIFTIANIEWFREGFRLGVALMLETL